jgi:hypothetical protein
MSSQCVTLIDHARQVVATVHVAEQHDQFIGRIDCSAMPLPLQRLFYWEPQRQAITTQYRFMAYTLRYHGTAPWPEAGEHYSVATHAAELAAFIRQLHAGPVHLVGLSSGGRLAILVALEHPDLVRGLTLAELQAMDVLLGVSA